MKRHLQSRVGPERSSPQRYWQLPEEIREELDTDDFLGALRSAIASTILGDPHLLAVSYFMMRSYPFANRLVSKLGGRRAACGAVGAAVVILSDGDVVFQPHKVYRPGLFELFDGNVLIYVHKEHELRRRGAALSRRSLRSWWT